ncbi:MAG: porin, partial [Pseudomonadota bacterium]
MFMDAKKEKALLAQKVKNQQVGSQWVKRSKGEVSGLALGLVASFSLGMVGSAHAQQLSSPQASSSIDDPIQVTGSVSVVAGAVDGELEADANAQIGVTGSTVLDSGIELGAAVSVQADGDAVGQRFGGGRYSSLLFGGTRGDDGQNGDIFLEGAYLFARGGFGSLHIGRDKGIASRLAVTSPTIFRSVGDNDWRADFTGLNDVHTVNDFCGQASKLTYMPPSGLFGGAIGQLQLGLSYAPSLGECGEERCSPVAGFLVDSEGALVSPEQSWRDVFETAVYYENGLDLGEEPLTIGFSASYVQADENGPSVETVDALGPLFGDYRSYAVGLNLAVGNFTLGGSMKSTNAGLNEDRDEDYLAFDAGVTYAAGEWNFMLGYGAADAARD